MIKINRKAVDGLSKQLHSKKQAGSQDEALYTVFSNALLNLTDNLRECTVYEMAHWITYTDRWLYSRKSGENTKGYKRGSIVFVDLGAENYGHEPSFTHPAIILDQNKHAVLIAPCSSKKYGKGLSDIVDADTTEGFSINTGVQAGCVRWISKKRIISVMGNTTSAILTKIDAYLLRSIPLHRFQLAEKDKKNQRIGGKSEKIT